MGGLFSSKQEIPKYKNNSYNYQSSLYRTNTLGTFSSNNYEENIPDRNLRYKDYSRNNYEECVTTVRANQVHKTLSSKYVEKKNEQKPPNYKQLQQKLLNIINQSRMSKWSGSSIGDYQLIHLANWSDDYNTIYAMFMKNVEADMYDPIIVEKIVRVENPYLIGRYLMKKLEFHNRNARERLLFHGTKRENISSICNDNFNWRLHGSTKGNIFGKGVSFATRSAYANHYCDRKGSKVMIVAKVLVGRICDGSEFMEIPPYCDELRFLRYDTSAKQQKKDVLVKYSDDEFYPAYLIYYTGKMYYQKGFSR